MLAAEAITDTFFGRFIPKETVTNKAGKAMTRPKVGDKSGLVTLLDDVNKGSGDRIRCGLRIQLQGEGVLGDATLEGNEESLDFYSDDILINQFRHAVKISGKMTEQRVPYNLREEAKNGIRDYFAARFDEAAFNHLCGYTPETRMTRTGQNAVLAPTTNRHIVVGNAPGSADEAITAADTFNLDAIDYAVEKAKTVSIAAGTGAKIRPIRVKGEDMYVMFLHPYQVTQLRTDSNSKWFEIQKAMLSGQNDRGNPIFTGALGVYNNVVLHETDRITPGVNGSTGASISTVRRAIFCGAQSLGMAFGKDKSDGNFGWREEMFDYGNQLGVKAGSIFGIKKMRFNPVGGSGEDFGTIVVSSYAAASA
jgi:N4-gp56 family major capsid protein